MNEHLINVPYFSTIESTDIFVPEFKHWRDYLEKTGLYDYIEKYGKYAYLNALKKHFEFKHAIIGQYKPEFHDYGEGYVLRFESEKAKLQFLLETA